MRSISESTTHVFEKVLFNCNLLLFCFVLFCVNLICCQEKLSVYNGRRAYVMLSEGLPMEMSNLSEEDFNIFNYLLELGAMQEVCRFMGRLELFDLDEMQKKIKKNLKNLKLQRGEKSNNIIMKNFGNRTKISKLRIEEFE